MSCCVCWQRCTCIISLLWVLCYFLSRFLKPNESFLDAHAIYLLNLLLAFLQPRFDPSLQEDLLADEIEEGADPVSPLPSQRDDEFRPFVRRLPEWQFWCVLCLLHLCAHSWTYVGCHQLVQHSLPSFAHFPKSSMSLSTGQFSLCISSHFLLWQCASKSSESIICLWHKRKVSDEALSRHMVKYKYIPFDIGRKTRYGGAK